MLRTKYGIMLSGQQNLTTEDSWVIVCSLTGRLTASNIKNIQLPVVKNNIVDLQWLDQLVSITNKLSRTTGQQYTLASEYLGE